MKKCIILVVVMFLVQGCTALVRHKSELIERGIEEEVFIQIDSSSIHYFKPKNGSNTTKSEGDGAQYELHLESAGTITYWLSGYQNDPTCCWTLKHIRCEEEYCTYECIETGKLYSISCPSDHEIVLKKIGRGLPSPPIVFTIK